MGQNRERYFGANILIEIISIIFGANICTEFGASLLQIGYRRGVDDKEKLVNAKHRYNLEKIGGRIMQNEY